MPTRRLCLWSGPRNVSTALLYSFAQRPDTRVIDEPLYAHYLGRSGVRHPGREEVLAAQDNDGARVVREVILGPCDREILFLKQMAHHLTGLDHAFLRRTVNVLLIRDPADVLRSLVRQIPQPRLADVGIAIQAELYDELRSLGQDPAVLDARQLLLDPPGVLTRLCRHLGIPFDRRMLSWPAASRSEDGVWAVHWYQNVHRSTGFGPYRAKTDPVPGELRALVEICRPYYDSLMRHALVADEERPS